MLKRRGIILALVSKNDPARIAEIWPKVFHARLQLDDFAIHKISWGAKPDAVADAIAEANVLPTSVVFIDDNPLERAAVEAAFPGIRTLGAPHFDWRMILLWSAEAQVATITDESNRRTDMIRAQVVREGARQTMDRSAFLASLGLVVTLGTIESTNASTFARAFELVNKTNQFNTTGRRWTQDEAVAHFTAGGRWWTFAVQDRFTAYGLVGVLIERGAQIEQFVMSCRVFGLGIERAVLAAVSNDAVARGVQLSARFVATERNGPSRTAYPDSGWQDDGDGLWRAPRRSEIPSYISLTPES